jgi:hypothetical protein
MATTVTIREVPGGRMKTLDGSQTRLFLNELARVMGPWPLALWIDRVRSLFSRGTQGPRIQADCTIEVDRNGRITEYELFSGSVLRLRGSRASWQFYFGLLLVRWLEA